MPALLGAKLRRLREEHGLTQADLAERLGLTAQSHIAKLEAGQRLPSLDVIARAAAQFDVSVDALLRDATPVASVDTTHLGPAQALTIDPARLGEQIRELRLALGLSQVGLARQLGSAGQSGIGKIERGEKLPSLDRLVQLADAFGTTVDDIFLPALLPSG